MSVWRTLFALRLPVLIDQTSTEVGAGCTLKSSRAILKMFHSEQYFPMAPPALQGAPWPQGQAWPGTPGEPFQERRSERSSERSYGMVVCVHWEANEFK